MPRHSVILQVFVASPRDFAEARAVLDSVVAELNGTWSRSLSLTFEVLKWATSARPGAVIDNVPYHALRPRSIKLTKWLSYTRACRLTAEPESLE